MGVDEEPLQPSGHRCYYRWRDTGFSENPTMSLGAPDIQTTRPPSATEPDPSGKDAVTFGGEMAKAQNAPVHMAQSSLQYLPGVSLPLGYAPAWQGGPSRGQQYREEQQRTNDDYFAYQHYMTNGESGPRGPSQEDGASSARRLPPCVTVSGKIVPVGTLAHRPLDIPPSGQTQHGISGPHFNIYRANQNPNNGQCFWQSVGAVPAGALPADAIPIEPFLPPPP